jgi:outer membrane protein assembly factor BamB
MNENQTLKIAANTSIVAFIFSFIVAILLLMNYYRLKANDPLELKSMELLVERLKDEPNNEELKNEIRSLDLLARKAFFTSQWQVKTGRYLLLLGSVVWIFAMRYYFTAKAGIQEPRAAKVSEGTARAFSQRWIMIAGGTILLLAFMASFAVNDHLKLYQPARGSEGAGPAGDESIEVISITESTDTLQLEAAVTEESQPAAEPAAEVEPVVQTGPAESPVVTVPSGTSGKASVYHNVFRGPFGNGVSQCKNIPVDWDGGTGRNIRWKMEISKPGYNSPVLWEDKLFLAGGDSDVRLVYCFNAKTGELIWQREVRDIPGSPATPPRVSEDTGLSAPSAATDGIRVYAIFATGDIIAFTMTGNRAWARNLGVPDNHYGHSSSLIIWKDLLLVQYDSNKGGKAPVTRYGNGQYPLGNHQAGRYLLGISHPCRDRGKSSGHSFC